MDNKYCIVPTKAALLALQNHKEGECVYCEEDSKIYSWREAEGWGEISLAQGEGLTMNLYDLNQSIIGQLEPLTNTEIACKIKLFKELQNKYTNIHYMLLCNEYKYYTIFESDRMTSIPDFGSAVCEIISNLGKVMSVEFTAEQDAIEIWIIPEGEEAPLAFYLFPYDAGVVYYG